MCWYCMKKSKGSDEITVLPVQQTDANNTTINSYNSTAVQQAKGNLEVYDVDGPSNKPFRDD